MARAKLLRPAEVEALFRALCVAIPHPRSDLEFANPFQLLVAVILSAQSTDKAVNQVTPRLFALAPTPQALVDLGLEEIKTCIKTLGLYNNKAKSLVLCAQALLDRHQGRVPADRASLEALAGVGVKTAGVVMNVAFGAPTLPVDTHVFRVANRLGLVHTLKPELTEAALLKVVPAWVLPQAHHLLILHGRYCCKARKPACPRCPLTPWCRAYATQEGDSPNAP